MPAQPWLGVGGREQSRPFCFQENDGYAADKRRALPRKYVSRFRHEPRVQRSSPAQYATTLIDCLRTPPDHRVVQVLDPRSRRRSSPPGGGRSARQDAARVLRSYPITRLSQRRSRLVPLRKLLFKVMNLMPCLGGVSLPCDRNNRTRQAIERLFVFSIPVCHFLHSLVTASANLPNRV